MDRNKLRKNSTAISALLVAIYCATCPAKPLSMSATPRFVIAQGDQDLQDLVQRFSDQRSARAASEPDAPLDWDMPQLSIKDAALYFYSRLGVQGAVDAHDMRLPIGPFRGRFTPRELWSRMMDAGCAEAQVSDTGHTYSANPKPIPGLNDVKTHYALPAAPLVDMVHRLSAASKGLPLSIAPVMHSQLTVGPIEGDMTMEEALLKILGQIPEPGYTYLYLEPSNEITLIWKDVEQSRQDLTQDAARAQLCLARVPPKSESMVVVATPLPPLGNGIAEPTVVLDRQRIEETGVDSVPALLQHLSQTAFHRGRGYRASGAQYAELRGIGHQFTKVLINGRPTINTAADLMDGAFDLNAVPLSAVERVEIVLDAVSLAHGANAIGGTVNLVLQESDEAMVDARYQSANGGAATYRGSIVAGLENGTSSASIVLDYSRTTRLLGASRDRWRNQDWTQHGGTDYRASTSAPANVRSLDGQSLPGLSSSSAGVSFDDSGSPVFHAGQQNLSSLLAWQSIVPDFRRTSVSAVAHRDVGSTLLSSELLVTQRSVLLQFGPEVISDLTLGARHPQNPFGTPIAVSAALIGLPLMQQEADSTLVHGVLAASGSILGKANYQTYLLHASDSAEVTWRNSIDLGKVIEGLSDQAAIPFNILTDAPGAGGMTFLAPKRTRRDVNGATQIAAQSNADIWQLPGGPISGSLGLEARREFAKFLQVGKLERDVVSAFGSIQAPIFRGMKAELGIRRDDYEGLSPVTSRQYILRWQPSELLRMHASYSDAFDPPDFWDLRFPKIVQHGVPIFDPRRGELASVTYRTGGNEELRPTTGHASSAGIKWGSEQSHLVSLSLWYVELQDRISLVPPMTLLANEGTAIPGRIGRETPSPEDVANNRPGRLITLDTTRANFGTTKIQGVDFTLATTLRTSFGSLQPRLDVSYSDEYRVTLLPTTDSPEWERTGVASEFGTITKWRLRGSLTCTHRSWTANVFARYNSCYEDFLPPQGQVLARTVCPGVGLDVNVSKELSEHTRITLGVSDFYTSSVPFAEVSLVGFDLSQRDLTGATGYVDITFKL